MAVKLTSSLLVDAVVIYLIFYISSAFQPLHNGQLANKTLRNPVKNSEQVMQLNTSLRISIR